ncbi:hypothetical protein EXIGLDRAFT_777819 [Exidia glandulosa HHB12029]|uniref:Uncharacterized protein n=1 Tax=Exidia glandulosa HHB12029 TaxID=1314781 RepID=A0A165CVD0_EXIGL|nr:hypothetical protein EXIGLDRAFT_777819 [Exidia glandulosa HHB12029]
MPPGRRTRVWELEYIMDAQAFLGKADTMRNTLQWFYRVKWVDHDFDAGQYPADNFTHDTLVQFWRHVDPSTARPDGRYTHLWRVAPNQAFIDMRILEALSNKKHELPEDEEFDSQAELDALRRRNDFALLGRSINTASALARENQESIYRRIRAPFLTGFAPMPVGHRRSSRYELSLILDELFNPLNRGVGQPVAQEPEVHQVTVDDRAWEAPQMVDIVINDDDFTEAYEEMGREDFAVQLSEFNYEEIIDDGWPARLKRIPFNEHRTPQQALFATLGTQAMRHATKSWRGTYNRICTIQGDGRSLGDYATECGHFFVKSALQSSLRTFGTKCVNCRKELVFCPFPAVYLERPKHIPSKKDVFEERPEPVVIPPPYAQDAVLHDAESEGILQIAETQFEREARRKAKKNSRRGGKDVQKKKALKAAREAREASGKKKNRRGKGGRASGQTEPSQPSGSSNVI